MSNAGARAAIDVSLPSADGGQHVEVTGCLLEGARRGVALGNIDNQSDAHSTAVFETNVIRGSTWSFGQGILMEQAETTNQTWAVELSSNRIYGNLIGLQTIMFADHDSKTTVTSRRNIYRDNGVGLSLIGGFDFIIGPSRGNLTTLDSRWDAITNNSGPDGRGVLAIAGLLFDPSRSGGVSGNDVRLKFLHTTFTSGRGLENGALNSDGSFTRIDLLLLGAYSFGSGVPVGTDNTVSVLVRRATSDGALSAFYLDTDFDDPSGSNRVLTTGSDRAFVRANEGLLAPFNLGG